MIQQNKKLIESQTKKLFIISLCCFFFGGIFSSLDAWKTLFVHFEAEFISNLEKKTRKNIALKTLLMNFNLKIRVFNNFAILLFLWYMNALWGKPKPRSMINRIYVVSIFFPENHLAFHFANFSSFKCQKEQKKYATRNFCPFFPLQRPRDSTSRSQVCVCFALKIFKTACDRKKKFIFLISRYLTVIKADLRKLAEDSICKNFYPKKKTWESWQLNQLSICENSFFDFRKLCMFVTNSKCDLPLVC